MKSNQFFLVQPAFALGFDSIIATCLNIIPEDFVKIVDHLQELHDVETARAVQEHLTAAVKIITKNGHWIPTMKAAMNSVTPINVGPARPPLKNLTPEQVNELKVKLSKHLLVSV